MFGFIAGMLAWFYDQYDSYALAIALLTLIVLVISTPLTLKGTASMLKMQVLQPDLKAIQNKYGKDEREEMNVELMAFYKDNNINPVGGCIPMLFQIPVFLVLYRVILGLTRRATDVGFQLGEVVGAQAGNANAAIYDATSAANFNPAYLSSDSKLFAELSSSNEMTSLGFDISRSASQVISESVIDSLPYLALVLVVGLTGWFQHRMIRLRQTGAPTNPTQDMIMKFMPYFLPVFSFTLPAAIVVYFLVSNIYRIGQQYYITRSMYSGDDSLGAKARESRETASKNSDKGSKNGSAKSANKKSSTATKTKGGSKNRQGGSKSRQGGSKNRNHNGSRNGSKKKPKTVKRGSAPGRNTSGRQGSARNVQPKARKKRKR